MDNDTGQPIAIRGRDRLGEHAVWSLQCFPDWGWTNIQIFETHDPNFFWVECDGEGGIRFPGYPDGDGKIKVQREFMNPFEQLRALSIPVPEIRREGIPRYYSGVVALIGCDEDGRTRSRRSLPCE